MLLSHLSQINWDLISKICEAQWYYNYNFINMQNTLVNPANPGYDTNSQYAGCMSTVLPPIPVYTSAETVTESSFETVAQAPYASKYSFGTL